MDYLVGDSEGAKFLRNNFVFKIVPMLNPDGVIVGNYRCSLSGLDLNRQWVNPSTKTAPENYSTKMVRSLFIIVQMLRKTQESRDILYYCDFHGHSRCKNLFMYGCSNVRHDRLKERVFPLLFHNNCELFSFNNCSFNVQKQRESTARVVMWREFQLINSFTLEVSFCGPTSGLYKDCHFTISALKEMGDYFCKTLIDYAENGSKVMQAFHDLEIMFPKADDPTPTGKEDKNDNKFFGIEDEETKDEQEKGKGKKKTNTKKLIKKGPSEVINRQTTLNGERSVKHSESMAVGGRDGDGKRALQGMSLSKAASAGQKKQTGKGTKKKGDDQSKVP